jgi:transcriptional regulator with XRE-family HTH domain
MTKKKRPPSDIRTPAGRLRYFFEVLFESNQSRMAESLGCSQAVISKILLGQQQPGARVLSALAGYPRVNPAWLLTGDGEPLLANRPDDADGGWLLPIAHAPLPGAPQEHKELMSGDYYSVAGSHHRPSRYWLPVGPADPITRDRTSKVAAGDLLLMESDASHWQDLEKLDRRLGVVRVRLPGGGNSFKVAQILRDPETHEEPAMLRANTFDLGMDPDTLEHEYVISLDPNQEPRIFRRHYSRKEGAKKLPARQIGRQPIPTTIFKQDIVAVCVMIVRRFE